MIVLSFPYSEKQAFPLDLPTCLCSRGEIEEFAKATKELGVQYVGLCCGNAAHYTRIVAEAYGRTPPASKYSPEMEKHFIFGDQQNPNFKSFYTDFTKKQISGC